MTQTVLLIDGRSRRVSVVTTETFLNPEETLQYKFHTVYLIRRLTRIRLTCIIKVTCLLSNYTQVFHFEFHHSLYIYASLFPDNASVNASVKYVSRFMHTANHDL